MVTYEALFAYSLVLIGLATLIVQICKNVCPARLLINVQFMRENRIVNGRKTVVKYIVGVAM